MVVGIPAFQAICWLANCVYYGVEERRFLALHKLKELPLINHLSSTGCKVMAMVVGMPAFQANRWLANCICYGVEERKFLALHRLQYFPCINRFVIGCSRVMPKDEGITRIEGSVWIIVKHWPNLGNALICLRLALFHTKMLHKVCSSRYKPGSAEKKMEPTARMEEPGQKRLQSWHGIEEPTSRMNPKPQTLFLNDSKLLLFRNITSKIHLELFGKSSRVLARWGFFSLSRALF